MKQLFELYKNKEYKKHILKLLMNHAQSGLHVSVADIIEHDSKLILPFFLSLLDPVDIFHCIVVQQYLRLLKRFGIQAEESLKQKFWTTEYMLYDLLTNRFERAELKLSHAAYKEYKNRRIHKLTASYSVEDYEKILHRLYEVQQTLEGSSQWQINQGILSILENLSNRNIDLSCKVLRIYLHQGDYLKIDPRMVMSNMLLQCEATEVFDIINTPEYSTKNRWLFSYYQNLPQHEINKENVDSLYVLYESSDNKYFINDLDYLLRYEAIEQGFVANIVGILIKRASFSSEYAHSISLLFNPNTEIYKNIQSVFFENFRLLEDAYMAADRVERHFDYRGSFLSLVLDHDGEFIERYIEDKFSKKSYLGRHDGGRDYSFIWMRTDFESIMERITSVVFERERTGISFGYYESFFSKGVNHQTDNSILDRQNVFLLREIEGSFNRDDYMRFLFLLVSSFPLQRKIVFYKSFLEKNKSFDDFKKLPYEPTISTCSEGAVPMLQERIDFYEVVWQLCNSVELLKHRQFVEQRIQEIRHQIQHEKKRDFAEG